jgi:chlorite dismutase
MIVSLVPAKQARLRFWVFRATNCTGKKINYTFHYAPVKRDVLLQEIKEKKMLFVYPKVNYTEASARALPLLTFSRRSRPLSDHGKCATGITKKLKKWLAFVVSKE